MRLIETLLEVSGTSELARDQLGAIILAESVNQQALATAASKDPRRWAFRVFVEASNPFEIFNEDFASQEDCPLMVNLTFDRKSLNRSKSTTAGRFTYTANYVADCYARGLSGDNPNGGHIDGSKVAATEAHRLGELVRMIITATHHQNIFETTPVIVTPPQITDVNVSVVSPQDNQAITLGRATLQVQMDVLESSPEVQATIINQINLTVNKQDTGELYFNAQYSV